MSEWELIEDPQEITAEYFPNEGGIMWEGKAYLPADYVLHADREPSDAARRLADVVEYVRKQTGPPASEWEHDPATILQAIDSLTRGEDTP